MPWAQPYDQEGRLHAGAQLLLIGGTLENAAAEPPIVYAAGTPLYTTKVGRAADPTVVEGTDSQDWDPVDKVAYGTVNVIKVGTKITIEGFFYFSKTPSQIIAKLYTGATVTLEFLPDRTNRLWAGLFKLLKYDDDFDTTGTNLVSFKAEAQCIGKLLRGADVAVPA